MKKCILFIFILLVSGSGSAEELLYSGKTMNTTYHIKIAAALFNAPVDLDARIEKRLEEINKSMSMFRKDSELTNFNTHNSSTPLVISDDFFRVMTVAQQLYKLTAGAWDGTVKPAIDLWGFGSGNHDYRVPSEKEIADVLLKIGFNLIEISGTNTIQKKNPLVTLDLSSIAKGYAVDQIAELLKNNGLKDFIVEIGGEVYASGLKTNGNNWIVGVNTPDKDAPLNQVYKALPLYNKALATSGDYRNFFEINGKRYSHIIDPVTGYPVSNRVVSASVVAGSCTFADGLATALMVMGHKKGLDVVERLDDVECLIIVQDKDGHLIDYASKGFLTKPVSGK